MKLIFDKSSESSQSLNFAEDSAQGKVGLTSKTAFAKVFHVEKMLTQKAEASKPICKPESLHEGTPAHSYKRLQFVEQFSR